MSVIKTEYRNNSISNNEPQVEFINTRFKESILVFSEKLGDNELSISIIWLDNLNLNLKIGKLSYLNVTKTKTGAKTPIFYWFLLS